MPTNIQNGQIMHANGGWLVQRATASLPQTAQTPIYTVSGGTVLVKYFVGLVTTAVQGQATTAQFIATPSTGTAVNLTNSTGDLNGKEIGSSITFATTLGGTAVVNNNGAGVIAQPIFSVNTGTIDFKTGASSTGAMKFYLVYIPLDPGAQVVTA